MQIIRCGEEFHRVHKHCEDADSTGKQYFIFIRIQQNKLYQTSVQFCKWHKNLRTQEHRKFNTCYGMIMYMNFECVA
jgi:hypothetical protein